MNIGFIGLGIMGRPMAKNLLKAGYAVTAFDINVSAIEEMKQAGAKGAVSPADAAEGNDVIFTMLPNGDHVKSVLFGDQGVITKAKSGTVVVDMSSISPVVSREIANHLAEKNIEFLDAPVSGGEPKAIDGTLALMVGGNEKIFESVLPIFKAMGENVTLVGDVGSGTTAKLANQILVNVHIAAMSEALILAGKAGIDIEKMYQAIRGGLAGSAVLDAKVPLILERNFVAGGRIDINSKDLSNVMATAHELNVPLPLTSQVLEMFQSMKADGKSADDHGGLIQHYEKLANFTLGDQK